MNDTEEYILDTEFIFNSGTKIYRNNISHKFNKYHELNMKFSKIITQNNLFYFFCILFWIM